MSRRRINNSKRRKEWRRYRAETLPHLYRLVLDAKKTLRRLKFSIYYRDYQPQERLRRIIWNLQVRYNRRWDAYETSLNDR